MGAAVAAGVGVGALDNFEAIDRFIKTDDTVSSWSATASPKSFPTLFR